MPTEGCIGPPIAGRRTRRYPSSCSFRRPGRWASNCSFTCVRRFWCGAARGSSSRSFSPALRCAVSSTSISAGRTIRGRIASFRWSWPSFWPARSPTNCIAGSGQKRIAPMLLPGLALFFLICLLYQFVPAWEAGGVVIRQWIFYACCLGRHPLALHGEQELPHRPLPGRAFLSALHRAFPGRLVPAAAPAADRRHARRPLRDLAASLALSVGLIHFVSTPWSEFRQQRVATSIEAPIAASPGEEIVVVAKRHFTLLWLSPIRLRPRQAASRGSSPLRHRPSACGRRPTAAAGW